MGTSNNFENDTRGQAPHAINGAHNEGRVRVCQSSDHMFQSGVVKPTMAKEDLLWTTPCKWTATKWVGQRHLLNNKQSAQLHGCAKGPPSVVQETLPRIVLLKDTTQEHLMGRLPGAVPANSELPRNVPRTRMLSNPNLCLRILTATMICGNMATTIPNLRFPRVDCDPTMCCAICRSSPAQTLGTRREAMSRSFGWNCDCTAKRLWPSVYNIGIMGSPCSPPSTGPRSSSHECDDGLPLVFEVDFNENEIDHS